MRTRQQTPPPLLLLLYNKERDPQQEHTAISQPPPAAACSRRVSYPALSSSLKQRAPNNTQPPAACSRRVSYPAAGGVVFSGCLSQPSTKKRQTLPVGGREERELQCPAVVFWGPEPEVRRSQRGRRRWRKRRESCSRKERERGAAARLSGAIGVSVESSAFGSARAQAVPRPSFPFSFPFTVGDLVPKGDDKGSLQRLSPRVRARDLAAAAAAEARRAPLPSSPLPPLLAQVAFRQKRAR